MAGDDFTLVMASETDWAWDLDAVVAALASTWPQAKIYDGYPVEGSTFRAHLDLPDPPDGRGIQIALDDSGKMISLRYGSPEPTGESVTWLLQRFPPPSRSPCNSTNGETIPESPLAPPSRTCSPSAP